MKDKDEIEKLFGKKLKQDNAAENGWNIPPNFVFDKAMSELDKNNQKSNKKNWVIAILFLLMCLSLGFGIYTLWKLQNLQTQIKDMASIESSMQENKFVSDNIFKRETLDQKQINELTTDIASSSIVQSDKNNITNNQTKKQSIAKDILTEDLISKNIKKADQNSKKVIDPPYKKLQEYKPSTQIARSHVSLAETNNEVEGFNQTGKLDEKVEAIYGLTDGNNSLLTNELKLLSVETAFNAKVNSQLTITELAKSKDKRNSLKKAYVHTGANYTSFNMTNAINPNSTLSKYEKHYTGFQAGIGFQFPIAKRISIQLQGSYIQYKNKSTFQKEMTFDEDLQLIDHTGELVYNTTMNVNSPLATSNDYGTFSLANTNLVEGDLIGQTTEIKENLKILSTRLAVNYDVFQINKFNFELGVGSSGNYIVALDENRNSKLYQKEKEMMSLEVQDKPMDQTNRIYFSIFGQVGLHYQIRESISIGLVGQYDKSISSLRKVNTAQDPETHQSGFNLNLQLGYNF